MTTTAAGAAGGTAAASSRRRGAGLHARACAAGAAASAVIHVAAAGQHAGFMAAGMLLMALLCLPCVLPLWRTGSTGAARMLMAGALGMVAVHAVLLLAPGGGAGGHQHGGMVAVSAGSGPTFTMLGLIGWELMVAMLAATWLGRSARTDRRGGTPAPAATSR